MTSLRPFAQALRDQLEQVDRDHEPVRDLADVLARAEVLEPEAIPAGLRESLPEGEYDEVELEVPGLSVFSEALRERHEHVLHQRQHAPIPSPPQTERRRGWMLALLGVAAVVAITIAIGASLSVTQSKRNRAMDPMEAERDHASKQVGGLVVPRKPPAPAIVNPAPPPNLESSLEAPTEVIDLDSEQPGAREDEVTATEVAPPPSATPPARPTADVAKMEAQARAAWRRGDLARAERLFRAIITRERRSSRADLAYGDLFSVVRQHRGAEAQAGVWRQYLRRFPRGRYAQDSRAGLCRRASKDERADCWQRYLDAHPRGTHVSEARAAVTKARP